MGEKNSVLFLIRRFKPLHYIHTCRIAIKYLGGLPPFRAQQTDRQTHDRALGPPDVFNSIHLL